MKKICDKIDVVLHYVAVASLLAIVLLITFDVILRYIFSSPISGSVELVEFFLIIGIALNIAQTHLENGHVSVNIIVAKLPLTYKKLIYIANEFITICIWGIIAQQSFIRSVVTEELSPVLHIPISPFYFIIALGAFCLVLTSLLRIYRLFGALKNGKITNAQYIISIVATTIIVVAFIVWIHPQWWSGSPFSVGVIGGAFLILLILIELPVAFALFVVGFLGLVSLKNLDVALFVSGIVPYRTLGSFSFSVIPCFVLMGEYVFYSNVSRDIYHFARSWVGRLPGGLSIATVGGSACFAAISGDSLSTTMTMSTISLPEMKKYKYKDTLSSGCIAAGGTLGVLIPPSIVFILYGLLTEQSIGKLFIAGIFPGVLLALAFCILIYLRCKINQDLGPKGPRTTILEKLDSAKGVWPVLVLFVIVIGGIYSGVFTPSEAGAVGASGAIVIGLVKRRLGWDRFLKASRDGGRIITMAFTILVGAGILGYFIAASKVPMLLAQYVSVLPFSPAGILLIILFFYTFLGMLMPAIPMVVITVPLFYPVVMALGFDPIWFGVITVLMFELAVITPPVGINIYGLSGSAPDLKIGTIFRGVIPFVFVVWICIIILMVFPSIATFLPNLLFEF